jgi:hypothetical protein
VLRDRFFDGRRTPGHRDERNERSDLHVIAENRVVDPLEPLDPVDGDRVRPDAHDAGAHLHERDAELLHVRLARGVVKHRPATREDGREKRVFGRGH